MDIVGSIHTLRLPLAVALRIWSSCFYFFQNSLCTSLKEFQKYILKCKPAKYNSKEKRIKKCCNIFMALTMVSIASLFLFLIFSNTLCLSLSRPRSLLFHSTSNCINVYSEAFANGDLVLSWIFLLDCCSCVLSTFGIWQIAQIYINNQPNTLVPNHKNHFRI